MWNCVIIIPHSIARRNIMGIYKNVLKIGNEERMVISISHKEETEQQVENTIVNSLHHIHILDRSGSMYNDIDNLIDNVQKTIEVIGEKDLLTIIWFSSAGQHRTVIKGATKFENLNSILDGLRSTLNCTCFSDPLKEVNLVIDEFGDAIPVSVTLFTDGNPVVPWSMSEEVRKCMAELEKMKSKILAFNTIGYGNYYNQNLLKDMSACSEYGSFIHSRNIDDYLTIFNHNFEKISEVVCESFSVTSVHSENIIYLNRTFTTMVDKEFHMTRINPRKNQVFIVGKDANDFGFEYQGNIYNSADIKTKMQPATITNFYYAYAYNMYYKGFRKQSLSVLANQVHDRNLVDSHINAFTYDESSVHCAKLEKALFNTKERLVYGECPDGYVPNANTPCVMDVLKVLQAGDSLYVPFSENIKKYERISRKATESINYFTKSDDEVLVPFSDFVYNKEHMNLSIRLKIDGVVKLNPKRAKSVGLDSEIPSCIFRNHTIIKDGNLNIKQIECLLTANDIDALGHYHVIDEQPYGIVELNETLYYRRVLNLVGLPIINQSYIDNSLDIDNIFYKTIESYKLEARQKIVNYYLDKVMEKASLKKVGKLADYTVDQIEVLEEHGLNKDLIYQGIERKVASAEDSDSYQSRTMVFYISGCTSIPKVEEMIDKRNGGKKLTTSVSIMVEQYNELEGMFSKNNLLLETVNAKARNILLDEQKRIKQELIKIRSEINSLKIAKVLTGEWFDSLNEDDKGNYFYEKDEYKMIAKAAYTTEYF